MRLNSLTCAASLLTSIACASAAPIPIPVSGPRADVDALAGEWQGEYTSSETGRTGTITFTLQTGRDTAFGEVIMIPSGYNLPLSASGVREGEPRRIPQLLTITFVRVGGPFVRGILDEYIEPDCRCPTRTAFTGRVSTSSRLEGTFESWTSQSPRSARGEWSARRVQPVTRD